MKLLDNETRCIHVQQFMYSKNFWYAKAGFCLLKYAYKEKHSFQGRNCYTYYKITSFNVFYLTYFVHATCLRSTMTKSLFYLIGSEV